MKKRSILIVDDDEEFLSEAETAITANGYEVFTASTGRAAKSILKKHVPTIGLFDKKLPDMDGQDLADAVKKAYKDIALIIITAYGSTDSSVNAFRNGLADYITKPASVETILERVKIAINAKEKALKDSKKVRQTAELQIALKTVEETNKKLERFDTLKSQFVSNVSHEISNPLVIIREAVANILDGLSGEINEETKDVLLISKREVDRLLRFTRNMLKLSRIESGKMPINRAEVNLTELLNEIIAYFKDSFEKNKIAFSADIEGAPSSMWADRDLLKELLINLLNNAMKYTPSGKCVNLKALRSDDMLRLEIKDEGSGISKEEQEKIFDKFYRIFEEKREGTGLGLPIAKEIVVLHKGRIWVESGEGKGSTFFVVLPLDLRKDRK